MFILTSYQCVQLVVLGCCQLRGTVLSCGVECCDDGNEELSLFMLIIVREDACLVSYEQATGRGRWRFALDNQSAL